MRHGRSGGVGRAFGLLAGVVTGLGAFAGLAGGVLLGRPAFAQAPPAPRKAAAPASSGTAPLPSPSAAASPAPATAEAVSPTAVPPTAVSPAPVSSAIVPAPPTQRTQGLLETAPSPVQVGTSVAAPGLPPLPPPSASATTPASTTETVVSAPAASAQPVAAPAEPRHARGPKPEQKGPSASLQNVLSFRYTTYRLTNTDQEGRYETFQASFAHDSSTTVFGGVANRTALAGGIGGGDGQVDGFLSGALLVGARTTPKGDQGLLGRVGLAGSYAASSRFRRSWFELPRGEVGYQVLTSRSLLELTAHGGLSLTGRFDAGSPYVGRGTDVTFAWGGSLALQVDPIRLAIDFTRTEPTGSVPLSPIDDVAGHLCAAPFGFLLFCGEAAQTWGDLPLTSGAAEARALRVGFTIGLGDLSHKSPIQALEPKPARRDDDDDDDGNHGR